MKKSKFGRGLSLFGREERKREKMRREKMGVEVVEVIDEVLVLSRGSREE